jgi:hypothetical protein
MRLSRGNATDLSRSVGGLLLATGAVVLFARKSDHHGWSDYALMLVVLIPAVVLYALALGVLDPLDDDRPRPWQTVLMVEAILLWPIALLAFLQWVGARTNHPLYLAGVFTVTCLLAAYATRHARIRYAARGSHIRGLSPRHPASCARAAPGLPDHAGPTWSR